MSGTPALGLGEGQMKDALLKFQDKFETFIVCILLVLLMFVTRQNHPTTG